MKEMTLWEHFEELRKRLIFSALVVVSISVVCYIYWEFLIKILVQPSGAKELVYLSYTEPFMARLKLSMWGGILISFPFILYQALAFIVPGLKKSEKRFLIVMSLLMVILFYGGVYFGYTYILKVGIKWLESQGAGVIKPNLVISQYISFVGMFLLALGACFETPVIVVFLARVGAVKPVQLIKQWRVAVVIILLFSAIATPDWSPVTMGLMSIPMFALYVLGVGLAYIFAPRKKRRLQQEGT